MILGGGISGLSAAWYLKKKHSRAKITLLEKESRLGGWVQTRKEGGFVFEEGPRTFPWLRSLHLRELIGELGLEKEILFSSHRAKKRYLWHQGHLRSIGSLLPGMIWPLIRGRFRKNLEGDVSIYDFAVQKYGKNVAETLIDPLVLGIFGGDIRKLSVASCFPEWQKSKSFAPPSGPLFALKGGMQRLIEELQRQSSIEIVSSCPVEALHRDGVVAGQKFWEGDRIVSALPGQELGRLTGDWPDFPTVSLWRVFLAYPEAALPKSGFGYLVPSQEKETVMGMVWDSEIFPQQNISSETRVTAMLKHETKEPLQ